MVSKCDLYCYNGLFMNKDDLSELGIIVSNGINVFSLFNDINSVIKLSNGKLNSIAKEKFYTNVSLSDNYCYMLKNKSLIILPITIYYCIEADNKIVAIYNNENIRNIKYDQVMVDKIQTIIDDMKYSESFVDMYNKQLSLKKKYDISTLMLAKLSRSDN